ncbi:MAG: tetratricopeptide repeat protein [Planctomycetota bacterium]
MAASIPNAGARYVGSNSCRECHGDISGSYQNHPMAHSLMTVSTATSAEDFSHPEFRSAANTTYGVEKAGTEIWHHEIRRNERGELIYDRRVPVHFAVGSGARGRSYLINLDGRLFQSPITWYTEGTKFDLSPGFVPGDHPGFDRRVNHACLSCHAGVSVPHESDPDRFGDPPFAEEAIGCERCHGPASDHVEYHRKPGPLRPSSEDPIVNPGNLSPALQDAVCNQCHLQGQRRVLRPGRTELDFRPGMNLSDIWTTILKTKGVESGVADAVSQVEQMHSSVCFQKSEGRMTCTSCHDPHDYPTANQKHDFYRSACLKCHDAVSTECSEQQSLRQAENDACIACHMPHFGAADVHSSQTDHRILRKPERGRAEQTSALLRPNELQFFREPGMTPEQETEDRAAAIFMAETGYVHQTDAASRYAVKILTPNRLEEATDSEGLVSLGKAYLQLGRKQDASDSLLRATELSPRNEEIYELLATAAHEANQLTKARQYYEKLISLNPNRARYHGRYAHVLGQSGDLNASVRAGERALELDPSLLQTHDWLVQMYQLLGDAANANRHQRQLEMFRTSAPDSETGKKSIAP